MVFLILAVAQGGGAPVSISATDPKVRYVGRWDMRDSRGPRAEWTASTVEVRFHGSGISVNLSPTKNHFVVEVDGTVSTKIAPGTIGVVDLASGLPMGDHVVRLVKETEPFIGEEQILGFTVPADTRLLSPKASRRRLEVIGDSISCGFGDEGANEKEHFTPATENGYLAYGAIAARDLHADYTCIAWSGRKMWPDNTIPSIYDLALPQDPTSSWAFPGPPPEAIVINLATNDFGRGIPDEKGWTTAYAAFIGHVREHAPRARIYCAIGTMMSDAFPPGAHRLTTLRQYLAEVLTARTAAGDRNIAILDFGVQDPAKNGMGSDYHPSLATHRDMAAILVAACKKDLRW